MGILGDTSAKVVIKERYSRAVTDRIATTLSHAVDADESRPRLLDGDSLSDFIFGGVRHLIERNQVF
jgi:hypothetical protein